MFLNHAVHDGFDSIQCPERKHGPFIPLAFAAMATSRVELAISVAISFPRSPMIVANLAWNLHRRSKGRFVVGLGTQMRPHNERRFSVPWVAPAARMGEYVDSLRANFRAWETGEKLNCQGNYTQFSVMTPEFSPGSHGLPLPPILIAAVAPLMIRTAARHCDGARLHGSRHGNISNKSCAPRCPMNVSGNFPASSRQITGEHRLVYWGSGQILCGSED